MAVVYRVSRGDLNDGAGDYLIWYFLNKDLAYAEAEKYKLCDQPIGRVDVFPLMDYSLIMNNRPAVMWYKGLD